MSGSTLITRYLTVTVGINGPTTPDSKANELSCREHCNTIDSSPIAAGRSGVTEHQRDGEESQRGGGGGLLYGTDGDACGKFCI